MIISGKMSFITLGDFSRQHFLQTRHVTVAKKKAGEIKRRSSTRVDIDRVRDDRVFLKYRESALVVGFSGKYVKL